MTEVVAEEFEHAGLPVKIIYDLDAYDPRESRDTLTIYVWATREYRRLKHDEEIDLSKFEGESAWTPVALAARWLTLFDRNAIAVPFQISNHGGGNYRAYLSDLDDDYCTGFVVVSEKDLKEELVLSPDWDVMEYIKAEFSETAAWIEGDVYGFVVADGDDDMDSCWGFYGDIDYVISQAKESAEAIARERFLNTDPPDIAEAMRLNTSTM
jgi:hypothetical protein